LLGYHSIANILRHDQGGSCGCDPEQSCGSNSKRLKPLTKFKAQGVVPVGSTLEELAKRIDAEIELWGNVIPSIGLRPE
jgi:hypothetical protein